MNSDDMILEITHGNFIDVVDPTVLKYVHFITINDWIKAINVYQHDLIYNNLYLKKDLKLIYNLFDSYLPLLEYADLFIDNIYNNNDLSMQTDAIFAIMGKHFIDYVGNRFPYYICSEELFFEKLQNYDCNSIAKIEPYVYDKQLINTLNLTMYPCDDRYFFDTYIFPILISSDPTHIDIHIHLMSEEQEHIVVDYLNEFDYFLQVIIDLLKYPSSIKLANSYRFMNAIS